MEKRISILKEMALKDTSQGIIIYQLLRNGSLNHIISQINNEKTVTNTRCLPLTKKGYLDGNEQFFDVLTSFINYFDSQFAPLGIKATFIAFLLEDIIPEFLLAKKYRGNNAYMDYYETEYRKCIVSKMYINIKFIIDEYADFFNTVDITDTLSLNNKKDVDILFDFMKKMVWSNYNNSSILCLFRDYRTFINGKIKDSLSDTSQVEQIVSNFKSNYLIHWGKLIKEYKKKSKYVEKIIEY